MKKEISVIEITDVKCPLCEGEMLGKTDSQSFMWKCKECPGVVFEYNDDRDIEFLKNTITK